MLRGSSRVSPHSPSSFRFKIGTYRQYTTKSHFYEVSPGYTINLRHVEAIRQHPYSIEFISESKNTTTVVPFNLEQESGYHYRRICRLLNGEPKSKEYDSKLQGLGGLSIIMHRISYPLPPDLSRAEIKYHIYTPNSPVGIAFPSLINLGLTFSSMNTLSCSWSVFQ